MTVAPSIDCGPCGWSCSKPSVRWRCWSSSSGGRCSADASAASATTSV